MIGAAQNRSGNTDREAEEAWHWDLKVEEEVGVPDSDWKALVVVVANEQAVMEESESADDHIEVGDPHVVGRESATVSSAAHQTKAVAGRGFANGFRHTSLVILARKKLKRG